MNEPETTFPMRGSVTCAWCKAVVPSGEVAKTNHWTIDRGHAFCADCSKARASMSHRLVLLLCAYGCTHGVIPEIVFEHYGEPSHRVWLTPEKVRGLFVSDPRADAAHRAFQDLTTLSPERAVLVRRGLRFEIEEKVGEVPPVKRAVVLGIG